MDVLHNKHDLNLLYNKDTIDNNILFKISKKK